MTKRFIVDTPKQRYLLLTQLLDENVFPIAYRKEQIERNTIRVTIVGSKPKSEEKLARDMFGPLGTLTKLGFNATICTKPLLRQFTLRVPKQYCDKFLCLWRSTSPGKRIGPWSCVTLSKKRESLYDCFYQISVHNEFAADALVDFLKTSFLREIAHISE